MTTKENFLKDLKDLLHKYNASCFSNEENGVPGMGINNLPNRSIKGFVIPIPNEEINVVVSGKDIYDFIYKK